MANNIFNRGSNYILNNVNIKSLVIGLSGGVDSTLSAALARRICDLCKIPLIGMSLPTSLNKKPEKDNAKRTGIAFCDEFNTVDIEDRVEYIMYRLPANRHGKSTMRYGNIIARLRMIFLYDAASNNRGLVLSTDNFTEYMLGFWTLHGDVGDLGLIQGMWKTEVYGLAEYLFTEYIASGKTECAEALFQSIRAVPTDGLGITDSDLDQIGASSYREVDDLLIEFLSGRMSYYGHPVLERNLNFAYKRMNPHNVKREDIMK